MHMWSLKEIMKTGLSTSAIFNSRKTPIAFTILFFVIINIGFSFPFLFSVLTLNNISAQTFIDPVTYEAMNDNPDLSFLKTMSMKKGRIVQKGYDDMQSFNLGGIGVLYDYHDELDSQYHENGFAIRITETYMEMKFGMTIYSSYEAFEDRTFSEMTSQELAEFFLIGGLRGSVSQWILPIGMFFYAAFFFMNLVFIVGLSFIALMFRLGDGIKLNYKETLNIVVYSSVLPTILSVVIALFFNGLGLNMIIYNFGTFIMYMLVRKNHLKKLPLKDVEN